MRHSAFFSVAPGHTRKTIHVWQHGPCRCAKTADVELTSGPAATVQNTLPMSDAHDRAKPLGTGSWKHPPEQSETAG
eukprot:1395575-Alexandrium_andersonii.AAC.1